MRSPGSQVEAWNDEIGEWRVGTVKTATFDSKVGFPIYEVDAPTSGRQLKCPEHWVRDLVTPNGASWRRPDESIDKSMARIAIETRKRLGLQPLPDSDPRSLSVEVVGACPIVNCVRDGDHVGRCKDRDGLGIAMVAAEERARMAKEMNEATLAQVAMRDLAKIGTSFMTEEPPTTRNDGVMAGQRAKRGTCKLPPPGWFCTLADGHGGSCSTWPIERELIVIPARVHTQDVSSTLRDERGNPIAAWSSHGNPGDGSYALKSSAPFALHIPGKCNKQIDDKVNYCLDRADHEGECGKRGTVFILSEKHAAREALVEFEEACGRIKAILRKRIEEL